MKFDVSGIYVGAIHESPQLNPTEFTPGVDSNTLNAVDSYPYGSMNGWKYGIPPGCVIPATIDIDSNTLNFKSKGKWITAYIELPKCYYIEDIDIDSVTLTKINNDSLDPPLNTVGPSEIGDYDDDGIPDLMVKFDQAFVQEILEVGNEVELTVAGQVAGIPFEGTDMIRVINKGKPKLTASIPGLYSLSQNHPNPFNPDTQISFQLPVVSGQSPPHIALRIYNLIGQEVRTLVNEVEEPGSYTVTWDGRDSAGRELASGVYFYQLSVDGPKDSGLLRSGQWSDTKRMVLLK